MIEIQNLGGKTKSEILNSVLELKSTTYTIYIPKSTKENFSEKHTIAIDYNKLAYAGQLLKNISSRFRYDDKVTPDDHESVLFEIQVANLEKLAGTLLEISFGYVNDGEDDLYNDIEEDPSFDMNADQYLYDVNNGNIKEPACPYFCQNANQYFEEAAQVSQD